MEIVIFFVVLFGVVSCLTLCVASSVFCVFPVASAPSRTLARRKLAPNRFTINTDIIFHGNNNNNVNVSDPSRLYLPLSQHALLQSHKPQGEDTDRWVEEQFDLRCYEEQGEAVDIGQVKETDILSDDDEYCKSVRAASAEPADLDGRMERLDVQGGQTAMHKANGQGEAGGDGAEEGDHKMAAGDSDSGVALSSCGISLSRCGTPTIKRAAMKQCAVEEVTNKDCDAIWVRRDDFVNSCNSDVFWSVKPTGSALNTRLVEFEGVCRRS